MRALWKQTTVEWGFVALLAAACAVLTVLQYRWTGEIGRAEAERLRGGLGEQAQRLCNTFDSALTESCNALAPGNEKPDDATREAVHLQCFQKWKSLNPRPLFRRIGVVVPMQDGAQLFEQSQATGKLTPVNWPAEWRPLYEKLDGNVRGMGGGPFDNPTGTLIEFPVFGGQPGDNAPPDGGGPPGENEWVVFELDTNYLANVWLPELARTYLNPGGRQLYDVVVSASLSKAVIFASPAAAKNSGTPVAVRFNRQGRDPKNPSQPGGGFRWTLEVRSQPDALEKLVSVSRRKNLAVALSLNLLILAAGLALVRHTRRSRQLAEQQMNFVAGVSHELRTPLTVIRGAAHNLERGVVTERGQVENYSRLILEHAEQLGEMVEAVLALAGAQKKTSAALREPVALAEVLQDAVTTTAHDTQAAQCEVRLELPPSLPTVFGDASALRRVFQNLITNAAKHGGGGKWIGITAVADEDRQPPMVEIQVADRGPGIPAHEQAEIFKPFYRGALTRALQVRGNGLGLSLVKEIVVAHGGNISVRSPDGHGATFVVRLPVAKKENPK